MSTVEVSTLTSFFDLAALVRTVAEGILATTAGGTPPLSYVSASRPAYDCCPALIVWAPGLDEEATNPLAPIMATGQRALLGRVNLATIQTDVLRCSAPVGRDGLPNTLAEESVAEIVLQDGWALWTGFYRAIDGETFKNLCDAVHFDGGRSIRDQGGCVGWSFSMRVEIAGIIS